ncbi:PXA domain protein, partial [Dictyocaulus viviparus]
CICSLFVGVSIAVWIFSSSDGHFLYPLINSWFSSKDEANCTGTFTFEFPNLKSFPWKGLRVSPSFNEAVQSLLDQIIDEYVNNWYEAGISRDRDFLNEVRYQIRFVCSQIVKRMVILDIPSLITEDILPNIALHMHRIVQIENQLSELNYHRSIFETRICERMGDLHFCMGSRRNELDYLRQVADFLILKLFDDSHLAGRAHEDDCASNFTGKTNMKETRIFSQKIKRLSKQIILWRKIIIY